jgi:receptor expression-enhancing protein 1/2/3/4
MSRIPFYAYLRFLFLLYLVLPQTQGARIIYQTYLHPWLQENEGAIEDFIASAHERLRDAGISYLKRAIELFKANVLGLPPSPEPAAAASAPPPQTSQSYTQSLLARFKLPTPWPAYTGASADQAVGDFYGFVASVLSAAAGASGAGGAANTSTAGHKGQDGEADMASSSATFVPDSVRGASARMSFLQAQRERLTMVLSALDREATELQSKEGVSGDGSPSDERLLARSLSEQSGKDGLAKSRSEADFEKLEAESGAEEMEEPATLRRRGGTPSGGGSWMPFWGRASSDTPADAAQSSSLEK